MAYRSWEEFFSRANDNRPADRAGQKESGRRTYDDFEHDYRRMYGTWFDHDYYNTIKQYGSQKAETIIKEKVAALNAEVLRREQEAAQQYIFHDVPEGCEVPF